MSNTQTTDIIKMDQLDLPLHISDWDDAYDNGGNIPNSGDIIKSWPTKAQQFRAQSKCQLDIAYGTNAREKYDLFEPKTPSKGLFVFIHGGYWQSTDKSMWSHLAKGAVDAGWTIIIPGYELCPNVDIATITQMITQAICHAAETISGPIILTGHSAGGHLVAELASNHTQLPKSISERIEHVVPISGLFDLRPLLKTKLNTALRLTSQTAYQASPAFKKPLENTRLTAWVGGAERPEFLRQNALLPNIWLGLGATTQAVEDPHKHHFDVIDGLTDQHSPLMQTILRTQ
jgi:arylformamidase